jgi:hypothetical protein
MKKATSLAKSLNAINTQLELLRKRKIQAILRPLHRERKKLLSRLEKIDHTIGSALGEKNGASQLAMKTIARGRKRIRRSGDELKKIPPASSNISGQKERPESLPPKSRRPLANCFQAPPNS